MHLRSTLITYAPVITFLLEGGRHLCFASLVKGYRVCMQEFIKLRDIFATSRVEEYNFSAKFEVK